MTRPTRKEPAPHMSGPAVDRLLLEGLASGDLGPVTAQDWERLKSPFRDQLDTPGPTRARAGWEDSFREMGQHTDDAMLDPDVLSLTSWDDEEWEWG